MNKEKMGAISIKTKDNIPKGIKLTEKDTHHLRAESFDRQLLELYKSVGSNIKELMARLYPENNEISENAEPIIIRHNLKSRTEKGYAREFAENEKLRVHQRKDQVLAHHLVIAFSPEDNKFLTNKILKDLAAKCISLRSPNSLVIGSVHRDRSHTHIHLVMSPTEVGTGKNIRISRADFQALKVALQEYQKSRYPQLTSLPEHGKSKCKEKTPGNSCKKIAERSLLKDAVSKMVETAYKTSTSQVEFERKIELAGYEVYFRNGRLQGLTADGLKFRFSSFGYDSGMLLQLEARREKSEKAIQDLRSIRSRTKDRERTNKEERIEQELGRDCHQDNSVKNQVANGRADDINASEIQMQPENDSIISDSNKVSVNTDEVIDPNEKK